MIKRPDNPDGNAHRVITFLTRDELDFLDKIGKDALFSAGTKLDYFCYSRCDAKIRHRWHRLMFQERIGEKDY